MNTQPLTPRQRELLRFVWEHLQRCGREPTMAEMALAIGVSAQSKGAITALVAQLVGKGYLAECPKSPRHRLVGVRAVFEASAEGERLRAAVGEV